MTTQAMEMISSSSWNNSTPCIMPSFRLAISNTRVTSLIQKRHF